ncbi:hypothetical protein [Ruegeria lacuscaerulensis]|uniref:hypothetical protein n=1 Tax=Ruegeria lacuscaerulensis TaxID=55218 RepID=UPI00147E8492|nr:hypothetical protein [Ruegeria lacuscaerulensis]
MQTPVFLDHLPDVNTVTGEKPARYRLARNKALLELMLDRDTTWTVRRNCPACGGDCAKSKNFSQTLLEFQRCSDCNTIYAQRVPSQQTLDRLRLDIISRKETGDTGNTREFEYISLMNWISLTEARLQRPLDKVVDIRFASHATAWPESTRRLSHNRSWDFLPLSLENAGFDNIGERLRNIAPRAVLMPTELDRVADPEALVRTIKHSVPAGTVIFIASSCADGLEYEILGADSPSFIPLDRLTVFSIKGFEALCAKVRLSVLEISTPGRLDAVILDRYFKTTENSNIPFWSGFFREADQNRLHDLQILLQRSLRSGVLRFVLET